MSDNTKQKPEIIWDVSNYGKQVPFKITYIKLQKRMEKEGMGDLFLKYCGEDIDGATYIESGIITIFLKDITEEYKEPVAIMRRINEVLIHELSHRESKILNCSKWDAFFARNPWR